MACNWRHKKIKKWSTKDVCDWIRSIGLSNKWQTSMIEAVEITGCTGQDWFAVKNGNDLMDSFFDGDTKYKMLTNRVYREWKKIKEDNTKTATSIAAKNTYKAPLTIQTEKNTHAQQKIIDQLMQFGYAKNDIINALNNTNNTNNIGEIMDYIETQKKKDAWCDKKIRTWTNIDLCDWIKSSYLAKEKKELMIKSIQNKRCTGKDWFAFKNSDDFAFALNIEEDDLAQSVYSRFRCAVEIEKKKEKTLLEYGNYVPPPYEVEEKNYVPYQPKPFYKWTTQDLCHWLDPMSPRGGSKMIKDVFRAKRCRGYDWMKFKSHEDVINKLGIGKVVAEELYDDFKSIWYEVEVPGGFESQLFGQSKYWKLAQPINRDMTVKRLKELYKAESGVGTNVNDIVLISKAKVLPDHTTLAHCGITNERHLITVKFKAHGGC
eukprot:61944_1